MHTPRGGFSVSGASIGERAGTWPAGPYDGGMRLHTTGSTGVAPLRRVSTPVALAVAVVAVAATGLVGLTDAVVERDGVTRSDGHILGSVIAHRSAALVDIARMATNLGSVGVLLVVAAVGAFTLWRRGQMLVVAVAPLGALLVCGAVTGVAKQAVGRPRPPIGLRLVAESNGSFPSGHSGDSTALYLTIGLVVAVFVVRGRGRIIAVATAGLLAATIGMSRLVLGVHWPTDVLAGWSLGAMVAILATLAAAAVAMLDAPGVLAPAAAVLRRRRPGA